MADPFSMAAVGMTMAGGLVKAGGDIFGGQAQAGTYQYQAGIAQMNARIAKQNANYATQKGEMEAMQSGMKTRFQLGQIEAGQAASGLDVNKGSAVAVRSSEQTIGNYDQAVLRSNAARAAYGYRIESLMDTEQAQLDMTAAKNAKTASYINAAGSILGASGSAASKWYTPQMQRPDPYGGQ